MDGMQAIELAQKEQPDLILLDMLLPKMTGLEVLKALKKATRNSKENRSANLNVLCSAMSQAFKPGATMGSRGQFPNVPCAGAENALTSTYGCEKFES